MRRWVAVVMVGGLLGVALPAVADGEEGTAVRAVWTAIKRLTINSGLSAHASVAASGNVVHLAWVDDTPGYNEIFHKRSINAGATWSASKRLSVNAGTSEWPSVAVSGNVVHVVWQDGTPGNDDIYYRRSTDGGVTWSAARRLTRNPGGSQRPSVAVSGNVVHVVWHDMTPGNVEVYYRRSANGGATWSAPRRLTSSTGASVHPAVAVSGNVVHVAWSENTSGVSEIRHRRSLDGGSTWLDEATISSGTFDAMRPSVAVSGSVVHVAWTGSPSGNNETYYRRSLDNGADWKKVVRLSVSAGSSLFPAVAVSGNVVHVVWMDDTPGNYEIFYRRSGDGGATWAIRTRLTSNGGWSMYPSVAASDGQAHICWTDDPSDTFQYEIYYRRRN